MTDSNATYSNNSALETAVQSEIQEAYANIFYEDYEGDDNGTIAVSEEMREHTNAIVERCMNAEPGSEERKEYDLQRARDKKLKERAERLAKENKEQHNKLFAEMLADQQEAEEEQQQIEQYEYGEEGEYDPYGEFITPDIAAIYSKDHIARTTLNIANGIQLGGKKVWLTTKNLSKVLESESEQEPQSV